MNANSRYIDNAQATLRGADGQIRNTILANYPKQLVFNYTYYKWDQDDRVDYVARDFFGSEKSWWMLGEANPEILDWTSLPVGTVIRIPSVR